MNPLPQAVRALVAGAEKVEELFGGWPRFHDAEVLRIALDREGPTMETVLRAFGPAGICTVTLVASGVDEVDLNGFNHQNVLADLSLDTLERAGAIRLCVGLEGVFGVRGSFLCDRLSVNRCERVAVRL